MFSENLIFESNCQSTIIFFFLGDLSHNYKHSINFKVQLSCLTINPLTEGRAPLNRRLPLTPSITSCQGFVWIKKKKVYPGWARFGKSCSPLLISQSAILFYSNGKNKALKKSLQTLKLTLITK